jgi:hypothetical protein
LQNRAFVGVTKVLTYQNARNEPYESEKLRVCENRVLWRIFGPKRDEEIGEWIRLYNEEFYVLYPLSDIFGLSNQEDRDGRGM